MTLRNTATEWGSVSKTFHWLMALRLIIQGTLGLTMGDFSRETRMELVGLHKSLGVTILMLVTARLLWNLYSRRPAFAPGVTSLERVLAIAVEVLLYALMFAIPIAGWLMSRPLRRARRFQCFQARSAHGLLRYRHSCFRSSLSR